MQRPSTWLATEAATLDPDWDDVEGQELDAITVVQQCGTLLADSLSALLARPFAHDYIPCFEYMRSLEQKALTEAKQFEARDKEAHEAMLAVATRINNQIAARARLEAAFRRAREAEWEALSPVEKRARQMSAAMGHTKPFEWYLAYVENSMRNDG